MSINIKNFMGDEEDAFGVGEEYFNDEDYETAAKWFELSYSICPTRNTCYFLASMYANGLYYKQDGEKAIEYYKLAIENNPEYDPDFDEFEDDVESMYGIGLIYNNGVEPVKKDTKQGAEWFMKAAKLGDPWSEAVVGMLYANGDGVEQSYEEALKWYKLAYEHGNDDALESIKKIEGKLNK